MGSSPNDCGSLSEPPRRSDHRDKEPMRGQESIELKADSLPAANASGKAR